MIKAFENSKSFLIKSGQKFQYGIFKLCERIINNEEIPASFDSTLLIQIFKGKGNPQVLSNSRFIHMKNWLPRICEAIVVEGMKEKILSKSSPFQLGGQPKQRPQFHLFTLKSLIGVREKEKRGTILTIADIEIFLRI